MVFSLFLYHIILPISLLSLKTSISLPRAQAEALVKWKNNLSSSSSLDSWSFIEINNLCNWTGIVCATSAGEVSEIDLFEKDYVN